MDLLRYLPVAVFVACYLLFVVLPGKRPLVAVIGALLLVISGALTVPEALLSINLNVMGIFVGTLALADIFMESRVPAYLAELIVNRAKNTAWAILLICVMTSFISAFVENVATVLIIAPLALSLAKKLNFNPVNMMIAIAISSNLQGTATLIGDPPSMLLGGFAKMNFMDFFFYQGKPSIFFAVELGALFAFIFLYFLFNHQQDKKQSVNVEKVKSWLPTALLVLLILALAGASFLPIEIPNLAGAICMVFAIVGLLWNRFRNSSSMLRDLMKLDWETTLFLAAIFILVGSLTISGWVETFAGLLANGVGENVLLGYIAIVGISVILSAFIDNVPFLATMLPLTLSLTQKLGINPSLYLFGLLIGSCLGGNITPIGASANIVACGLLKKEGHTVSFGQFMKIGLPFTLLAVVPAAIFVWFVWR